MADENFLQRWSRRKAEARTPLNEPDPVSEAAPEPADVPPASDPPPPVASSEVRAPDDLDAPVDLDALPDIDSLTYESDFTVFMRKGVPADLRKRALRRLWRSNPTLANLDGLVEYGGDYTKLGTTKEIVRTAYQVGRGMLARIEPREEPAPAEVASAAPREDAREPPAVTAEPGPDELAGGGAEQTRTIAGRQDPAPENAEALPAKTPRPLPKRS